MQEQEVIKILQKDLNFSDESIYKLKLFSKSLILANQKHNFISKSTEKYIWHRHILDSAQLVKFIDFKKDSLADLGSGAGFPGIILAIFNEKRTFHVKLYEKSPVKSKFLNKIIKDLELRCEVFGNVYHETLDADFIVSRAFKKLDQIIQVSREIAKKSHKLIIMKGQNAQEEVNKSFKIRKFPYTLEKSITNKDSKIISVQVQK
jgi:16S rRNA (guanine527-N7)-methyltransferase